MGRGCVIIKGGLKNTNLRSLVRFRFDGNNKVHSMNDEGNATKETFSLNPLTLYGPDFKSRSQILNFRLRFQTKSKLKNVEITLEN